MLPTVLSSKRTTRTESLISQAVMTTRTMQPDTRLRLKCQSVGLHQPPSRLLFSQCWHIIELHKQEEYAMFKASEALGNVIHCQNEKNPTTEDRKSTRLNSSHVRISYAVFCLKKK